jgi:hypothetical protein
MGSKVVQLGTTWWENLEKLFGTIGNSQNLKFIVSLLIQGITICFEAWR